MVLHKFTPEEYLWSEVDWSLYLERARKTGNLAELKEAEETVKRSREIYENTAQL